MRFARRLIGVIALAWLCLSIVLYSLQSSLIYYPDPVLTTTPEAIGLAYQDVHLRSADGVGLHGWYLPHPEARGSLLFFHGNAGNISHRLETLRLLHGLGLAVLIIDYRGYGLSDGEPSEQGTYQDAEAAWQWLVGQRGESPGRLVMFGRSLGGGIASWLATRHPPGALLLESTFTSIPDMATELYPFLPVRWLSRFQYATLDRIETINSPLWIAHSPDDEVIPYRQGRTLYNAADEPKQFFQLRGGHNDGFLRSGPAYRQSLQQFLDRWLAIDN